MPSNSGGGQGTPTGGLNAEVHSPTTSKNSTSKQIPAYMKRRVNIPGPNLGFPVVLTFGPKAVSATTAGQFVIQIPGGLRPIAFGWYCSGVGGASAFRLVRTTTPGGTAGGTTGFLSANIDLNVNANGIAYRNETGDSFSIKTAVTSFTGGADTLNATDPEMPPYGSTSQRPCLEVRFQSASSVTDFSCYLLCVPTTHANLNSASD